MPLVSLIVTFVVGLIVFLPFPSWQQLVGFVTSATVLSFGAGHAGARPRCAARSPDRERPFRVPFGDVIPFLAFYSSNLIVYWAGWDVNWKLFVAIALGFVLLGVFHLTAQGRHAARWTGAPARPGRCRGSAGLCLISYLGDYPDKSKHAGNTGDDRLRLGLRGHARADRGRVRDRA